MSIWLSHRITRLKIEVEDRVEEKEELESLEVKPMRQRPDLTGRSNSEFALYSNSSQKPLKD